MPAPFEAASFDDGPGLPAPVALPGPATSFLDAPGLPNPAGEQAEAALWDGYRTVDVPVTEAPDSAALLMSADAGGEPPYRTPGDEHFPDHQENDHFSTVDDANREPAPDAGEPPDGGDGDGDRYDRADRDPDAPDGNEGHAARSVLTELMFIVGSSSTGKPLALRDDTKLAEEVRRARLDIGPEAIMGRYAEVTYDTAVTTDTGAERIVSVKMNMRVYDSEGEATYGLIEAEHPGYAPLDKPKARISLTMSIPIEPEGSPQGGPLVDIELIRTGIADYALTNKVRVYYDFTTDQAAPYAQALLERMGIAHRGLQIAGHAVPGHEWDSYAFSLNTPKLQALEDTLILLTDTA